MNSELEAFPEIAEGGMRKPMPSAFVGLLWLVYVFVVVFLAMAVFIDNEDYPVIDLTYGIKAATCAFCAGILGFMPPYLASLGVIMQGKQLLIYQFTMSAALVEAGLFWLLDETEGHTLQFLPRILTVGVMVSIVSAIGVSYYIALAPERKRVLARCRGLWNRFLRRE